MTKTDFLFHNTSNRKEQIKIYEVGLTTYALQNHKLCINFQISVFPSRPEPQNTNTVNEKIPCFKNQQQYHYQRDVLFTNFA